MALALSQCPGITPTGDSSAALQAALNLKQPLVADCLVNCIMGSDYTKGIFVPDGSDVTFTPQGLFTLDSAGFPALAFVHATGIWRGLKIRYTGSLGVAMPTAPGSWTNGPAKAYLQKNGYNTTFSGVGGTFWSGPSNSSALISVRGASNVTFQGGKIFVDDGVTPDRFVYVAFGIDYAYTPGVICAPGAQLSAPNVTASDFELDGVCMGFVGGGGNVSFRNVTRKRYADLQDAAGGNVGGIGTWSSPPHFFYLQGSVANPMHATLKDCVDLGQFNGSRLSPRFLNSLKVELANGSSIDGYYSRCLDGGFAVLSNGSTVGGTAKNMHFMVDTSIVDASGTAYGAPGLFFPSSHPYPPSDIQIEIQNAAPVWPIQNVPASVNLISSVECGS